MLWVAGEFCDFIQDSLLILASLILNPQQRHYARMKDLLKASYEDNYWPEDAIVMERNSRDFISRISRINNNAEAICETLLDSPIGLTHLYA